jgi:Protein of unknown function (DUF3311)
VSFVPFVYLLDTRRSGLLSSRPKMRKFLLVVAVAALYILHQDIWFWRSSHLVFGFIPIGLFYQGCFSIAASLLMWLLVTFAWPSHLEQEVEGTNVEEGSHR